MARRWVVWYQDGSSFSDDDGQPWDAPRAGVICITQAAEDCGRFLIKETNFFCWHFDEQQFVPHDTLGMHDYLSQPGKEKVVLRGWWATKERFFEICNHALTEADSGLPAMSALRPVRPKED